MYLEVVEVAKIIFSEHLFSWKCSWCHVSLCKQSGCFLCVMNSAAESGSLVMMCSHGEDQKRIGGLVSPT